MGDVALTPVAKARLLRAVEDGVPHELLAGRFSITPANVRVIVSQLRRERRRAEAADTQTTSAEA